MSTAAVGPGGCGGRCSRFFFDECGRLLGHGAEQFCGCLCSCCATLQEASAPGSLVPGNLQPAAASRHRCATCRWPTSVWTVSIVQFHGPFGKPLHPPIHIAGSPDEHSTRTCEAVPAQYLTCTRQVFGVSHHPATVPHYSTRCEQLSVARRGQEGMLCMAADLPAPWL